MIKLLHSADWHLDAPLTSRSEAESAMLRKAMRALPDTVVTAAREHGCSAMLLSGDVFDGAYTEESLRMVQQALKDARMPVLIAPGNHDPFTPDSPWQREGWPENVHIFSSRTPESVVLPELDCRVYGAAFHGEESGSMLSGFRAEGDERWCVGVFHGDPMTADSPYNPVSKTMAEESALDYLALGHIHKAGSSVCGGTLCAWPGCPMGRGFDELGEKGVLLVTLGEHAAAQWLPLDTPRFHELEADVTEGLQALEAALPESRHRDIYRVTLTGEARLPQVDVLRQRFAQFPFLQLKDRTEPPLALWDNAGEDTLEGTFFALLKSKEPSEGSEKVQLAAQIARRLLSGREVKLP